LGITCRPQLSILTLAAAIFVSPVLSAQAPSLSPADAKAKTPIAFDPHDLSGMWDFYTRIPGQGIYATPSKDHPPFTRWAQAKYDAAKPGYGPKAQPAGNDPILQCDPSGVPRILFFPQPYEIVQLPDRTFMFFEREHAWRQIWTDGRDHPKDPESSWMGDSIGRWDGDTFVIDSIGFNDKGWLDFYGDPHSDELHVVERYRRVDRDTLNLQLIIDDPKAYTKTWVGDTKIFKLLTGKEAAMEELFCVSSEEKAFTRRIRMPAAAGAKSSNK
jgi:hypothetical protein